MLESSEWFLFVFLIGDIFLRYLYSPKLSLFMWLRAISSCNLHKPFLLSKVFGTVS